MMRMDCSRVFDADEPMIVYDEERLDISPPIPALLPCFPSRPLNPCSRLLFHSHVLNPSLASTFQPSVVELLSVSYIHQREIPAVSSNYSSINDERNCAQFSQSSFVLYPCPTRVIADSVNQYRVSEIERGKYME